MKLKICIRCVRVRELNDGYCSECEGLRPTTTQRGLGAIHRVNALACIAAQPWCTQCGTEGSERNPLTAGHIIPRKRGGTSDPSNLQTECRRCNSGKGSRPTIA